MIQKICVFLGVQEKTIVKNQKIFRQCYVYYVNNVSESLLNTWKGGELITCFAICAIYFLNTFYLQMLSTYSRLNEKKMQENAIKHS